MSVPTIIGTTCPSVEVLAREFVLVITGRFPGFSTVGYVGRPTKADAELDMFKLEDAFEYEDSLQISGDPKAPRVGRQRQIFPPCGLAVDSIAVKPLAVIRLADLPEKQVTAIRETLIGAWEGRAYLRKQGGPLVVAAKVEAIR